MDLHKLYIIIPNNTVSLEKIIEDSKGYDKRIYFHKDTKSIVLDGEIYGGSVEIDEDATNELIRQYLQDHITELIEEGPLKDITNRLELCENNIESHSQYIININNGDFWEDV